MDLTWADNSTNETGFLIQRTLDGTTWVSAGSVGAGVTAFTDINLTPQTTYTYHVKATGSGCDSTYSGGSVASTTAFPIISVSPTDTNLVLSFQSVTGKKYRLISNTTLDPVYTNWADAGAAILTGNGAVMSFTVAKPASGKIFYTVELKQ